MKMKVCDLESLVQKIRFCIEERKLGEGENSSMSWEQNRKCKQTGRQTSFMVYIGFSRIHLIQTLT